MEQVLERLVKARKQAGLSQGQAGQMIGMSASGFCDIEKGRNPLTVERLLVLCEKYEVSETWVLTGTNPNFKADKMLKLIQKTAVAFEDVQSILELLESVK